MDKKIKLGIFVESFPVVSETFVVNKVMHFLSLQYDVHVFTLKRSDQWSFFEYLVNDYPDIKKRIHIALPLEYSISNFVSNLACLIKDLLICPISTFKYLKHNLFLNTNGLMSIYERVFLRLSFVRNTPDILSVEFDTLGYKIVDLKDFLNCKIVVHCRGVSQATNSYYRNTDILKYLDRYADVYIYASKFLYKNSRKLGFGKNGKNVVVYAGVADFFITHKFEDNKQVDKKYFRIISVGRLSWSKGYEFGLEAVKIASKVCKGIKYIIIGDGQYKQAVLFAAHQMGLLKKNTVSIIGSLSSEKVRDELNKSDIFLQTSVAEGFGISSLEAQSLGLPVIVTDSGGLPETVDDGRSGYVVEKRNPYSIASKIIFLYKHREKARKLGLHGQKVIRQKHKLIDEMKKMKNIYEALF